MTDQNAEFAARAKPLLRVKTYFFLALLFNIFLVVRLPFTIAHDSSGAGGESVADALTIHREKPSNPATSLGPHDRANPELQGNEATSQAEFAHSNDSHSNDLNPTQLDQTVTSNDSSIPNEFSDQALRPTNLAENVLTLDAPNNTPAKAAYENLETLVKKSADSTRRLSGALTSGYRILGQSLIPRTLDVSDNVVDVPEAAIEPVAVDPRTNAQANESPSSVLVLLNPTDNGGMLHCLVDKVLVSLKPGQTHRFQGGPVWKVEFNRGGDFGDAKHDLTEGKYVFQVSRNGWKLDPATE